MKTNQPLNSYKLDIFCNYENPLIAIQFNISKMMWVDHHIHPKCTLLHPDCSF